MPRPGLPPTPGSSTDIKGKDGIQHLSSSLHHAFELPPPAIHDAARASANDNTNAASKGRAAQNGSSAYPQQLAIPSPQSAYPMQAAETVKARRRSSSTRETKDSSSFALPPPPTRSRKIIQMKPRAQEDASDASTAKESAGKGGGKNATAAKGAAAAAAGAANASAGAGAASNSTEKGKKKQPSATSAAGRKIARKTAHSLIERRRRSKMNEEFAVLKGMIPACTGEMHKLAILQASIEYIRYLEDCVSKLQAQHGDASRPEANGANNLPSIREFHPTFQGDGSGDVDMSDSDAASPTFTARPDAQHPQYQQYQMQMSQHQHQHQHQHQPSDSPALPPQDDRHRQHSYSSVSTDYRHHSFSTSATTSPAFGPQLHGSSYARSSTSTSASTLTSPALNPQNDLDQEATAALLMLNNDRRGTGGGGVNARGLSVKDLLSA